MRRHLTRLHERLGDFWWYSLMLFCACRLADLMNAFVGLWLVPKYVPPSELGAVLPLASFASFLALPIAAFAATFRNEISGLAIRREFGKLKTLMRGVFVAGVVFLFFAIVVSHFVLPHFLTRIRVVEGSLGTLILVSSFVGSVAPVYNNALQALKKFRMTSFINLLGAPIRLVTMLVAIPFRPIAGYFVGQASTPLFAIGASFFAIRKELAIRAEPYWTRDVVRRFGRLFMIFLVTGIAGSLAALVESTVLRQRLPEVDSAAYYMVTRFSEIACFLYSTLVFTIFPFTADLAAKGKTARPLVFKISAAIILFSGTLAVVFGIFGRPLLALLPYGNEYAAFWWAIPWMIGIQTLYAISGIYQTAEISANRFGYLLWLVPLNLAYAAALLFVTGYGHFTNFLPVSWTETLAAHNICSLKTMLWWMTGAGIARLLVMIWKFPK